MPFDVDNDPAAAVDAAVYAAQGQLDSGDVAILAAAAMGTGVVYGAKVIQRALGATMWLDIEVGAVMVNTQRGEVTATPSVVEITTADATNPRIDLVVSSGSGTITVVTGTPAVIPCYPAVTLDADGNLARCVLAAVYVPAGATSIVTAYIKDRRVYVHPKTGRVAKTGDYTANKRDSYIGYTTLSATRTVTLPAAADVPGGWELEIKDEVGSASPAVQIVVDGNGAETIDGLSSVAITAPYGSVRLRARPGSNDWTLLDQPSLVQVFSASGTWVKPVGAQAVMVLLRGSGGGGGSGARGTTAGARNGGGGGGGGVVRIKMLHAASLGATETVTIGAGGTGAAGKATDGFGTAGGNGGTTSFGSWLSAAGGTGGTGGTATNDGTNGGTASTTTSASMGIPAGAGGGGGGGRYTAAADAGTDGTVLGGGGGGGGGGRAITTGTATDGGAGGNTANDQNVAEGSGAAGVGQTAGVGNAGTAGTAPSGTWFAGGGGGGGAAGTTGAGGAGAAGLNGGGGGGGGGSNTGLASGAGGAGAAGYVVVVAWK